MASECTEVSTHHNANKRCSVLVPSTSVDVDGVHIKANSTLNKQGKQATPFIYSQFVNDPEIKFICESLKINKIQKKKGKGLRRAR